MPRGPSMPRVLRTRPSCSAETIKPVIATMAAPRRNPSLMSPPRQWMRPRDRRRRPDQSGQPPKSSGVCRTRDTVGQSDNPSSPVATPSWPPTRRCLPGSATGRGTGITTRAGAAAAAGRASGGSGVSALPPGRNVARGHARSRRVRLPERRSRHDRTAHHVQRPSGCDRRVRAAVRLHLRADDGAVGRLREGRACARRPARRASR